MRKLLRAFLLSGSLRRWNKQWWKIRMTSKWQGMKCSTDCSERRGKHSKTHIIPSQRTNTCTQDHTWQSSVWIQSTICPSLRERRTQRYRFLKDHCKVPISRISTILIPWLNNAETVSMSLYHLNYFPVLITSSTKRCPVTPWTSSTT